MKRKLILFKSSTASSEGVHIAIMFYFLRIWKQNPIRVVSDFKRSSGHERKIAGDGVASEIAESLLGERK